MATKSAPLKKQPATMPSDAENAVSTASSEAIRLYQSLQSSLRKLGPFREEVKKTSVHFVRAAAFIGVHFRKSHLIITIKAANPIDSPRVIKAEQVSKNRWHCEVKISDPTDIDHELTEWTRTAYDLCAQKDALHLLAIARKACLNRAFKARPFSGAARR